MAHWKTSFPSKYLGSADLDESFVSTIKSIEDENVGQGDAVEVKPVAHWVDAGRKPCVLNPTRCEALSDLTGSPDKDDWPGTRVLVRRGQTFYKGKKVGCIEFAAPPAVPSPKPSPKKPAKPRPPDEEFDSTPPPTDDDAPPPFD
jgi:hypothetical protein